MALFLMDKPGKTLGDETLRTIARELVETVRRNTTIDWTVREFVRAKLRTLVKRILRKYGYPLCGHIWFSLRSLRSLRRNLTD